jgi:outer membrane immunogenic protein
LAEDTQLKKLLLAAIGAIAMTASASAADLAARPYAKAPVPMIAAVYDWSGFYIGLNGGGATSRECWTITSNAGVPIVPNASEGCHNATGGLAGGQIGYRWQTANWVLGVEAQGDWANLTGSNASLAVLIPATNRTKIDGIGLLTGQVGYAWNNVLWYVKGGGAVVDERFRTFIIPGAAIDSATDTRWGGAIGTGVEVGFAPNWSVGVEYDHLFMGTRNINALTPLGAFSTTDRIRQDVDLGTVRVNYRWGGPVISKY